MTRGILILLLISTTEVFSQTLTRFSFSECLVECRNDSSAIEEIIANKGLAIIKIKTYAPCNGNFVGEIEIKSGLVNLKFRTKPTIIKNKDGTVSELVEVADCNCVFRFAYEVKGLEQVNSNRIKVNGSTLREIDARNIWENEEFEWDSIDNPKH